MRLFNKSGRAIIIDVKKIISGGRFNEHDLRKISKYFDPQTEIEVEDSWGEMLLKMYPKELMEMGADPVRKTKKQAAVKKAKRKAAAKK